MLKEHTVVFRQVLIFLDLCIIFATFSLAYLFIESMRKLYPQGSDLVFVPMTLVIGWYLFNFFKLYDSFRMKKTGHILMLVLKTLVFGLLVFLGFRAVADTGALWTSPVKAVFSILGISLILEVVILTLFFDRVRSKKFGQNILIIGTNKRAQDFIRLLDGHEEWGLNIVGIVDEQPAKIGEEIHGHRVIGSFNDLCDIIHRNVVDEVVFVVPRSWFGRIEELVHFCEVEGIRVNLAVDHFDLKVSRAKPVDFHGIPFVNLASTPDKIWHLVAKRVLDIALSAIALIFLSPVFLIVAALVKWTSPGPVFFKQERCSLYGRKFTLYKFRTMVADAEEKLAALLEKNEMKGPAFKMEDDPRVTWLGRILRKTSIDELPQLWNVFKGDMSLVGPRPPIPSEIERYDNWHRRRLSMRPGLTCLWQVSGRNHITDFDEWMKLDLSYIDRWSLWLDLKILFKTVPVVIFGVGAK